MPASTVDTAPAVDALADKPALKGILSTDAGPKAVFVDPATGTYLAVGVGDSIASYRIETIGSGQVVAQSADGEVTLYLRGAGELP